MLQIFTIISKFSIKDSKILKSTKRNSVKMHQILIVISLLRANGLLKELVSQLVVSCAKALCRSCQRWSSHCTGGLNSLASLRPKKLCYVSLKADSKQNGFKFTHKSIEKTIGFLDGYFVHQIRVAYCQNRSAALLEAKHFAKLLWPFRNVLVRETVDLSAPIEWKHRKLAKNWQTSGARNISALPIALVTIVPAERPFEYILNA